MNAYVNPLVPAKKPKATYNMTADAIDKITEDSFKRGEIAAVPIVNAMYSAAFLLALNAKYGFGKERLKRAFLQTQKNFEQLRDGEISYTDIITELSRIGVSLTVESIEGQEEDVVRMFQAIDKGKYKANNLRWKE